MLDLQALLWFVLMAKLRHACNLNVLKVGCEWHTQAADNVADLFWNCKVLTEVTAEVYQHLSRLSSKYHLVVSNGSSGCTCRSGLKSQ